MRVQGSRLCLCIHWKCIKVENFDISSLFFYPVVYMENSVQYCGFVLVIHHLAIANCFIILNVDSGKVILGRRKCFLLSHTVHLFKYYPFVLLLVCFYFYNSVIYVQSGRSVFCSACLLGRHYGAQSFFHSLLTDLIMQSLTHNSSEYR